MEDVKNDVPAVPEAPVEKPTLPDMQHIFITLADGRRGVFTGPALITAVELALNPPRMTSIDFSAPIAVEKPVEEPNVAAAKDAEAISPEAK